MATILLLETATRTCSVALSRDGDVVACKEITDEKYSHAEQLSGFIKEVLEQASLAFHDLDAVAVSAGPGSYTGLRIGTSTAKGLCFALDIPFIAISTLDAMADYVASAHQADFVVPMIDARRMEVYTAVYDDQGERLTDIEALILDESSFSEWRQKGRVLCCGNGSEKFTALVEGQSQVSFETGLAPSASHMARIAETKYAESEFEDAAYYEPHYLKEFVALKPRKVL